MDIDGEAEAKFIPQGNRQKNKAGQFSQEPEVDEVEKRADSPYHRGEFVGHYDYKSDTVKRLEVVYEEFQFQLYQSYVKNYKINHRYCRNALMEMKRLCHQIRKEVQAHNDQTIPPSKLEPHPSWRGHEDELT